MASDDGALGAGHACAPPSAWRGATIQWLNPKAWLASVARGGAHTAGEQQALWASIWVYVPICVLSMVCWA
ncbi:hypothetical protein [Pseudomonas sp. URMO17WK12:I11]|uniref:hypothetical protein n=1 Tax=Pseudomonas sp. URMO17WK12:I11 TaxID=1283291 RepID=UPI00119D866F|nr:hypothetical protein [Pseudomonas sp. URMO17WK12:I11]